MWLDSQTVPEGLCTQVREQRQGDTPREDAILPECGHKCSPHGRGHRRAPSSSKIQGQGLVTNENSGHLFEKF